MKIWGTIWKDGHLLRDTVKENVTEDTRTHRVFALLREIALEFDLEVPQWLDSNIADFQRTSKTRFTQDSFIEQIEFDYLEIQIIEE